MYSPFSIARAFLERAENEGKRLTPMALMKLTYLAHGWHLGLTSEPLSYEKPEAWQYGPVFRNLYHSLKQHGSSPIPAEEAREFSRIPKDDEYAHALIDQVWDRYKSFNGIQLSALTHQEDSPWYKTWHEFGGKLRKGKEIDNELIAAHYQELLLLDDQPQATS
jgi:uncharacterized phage-associated protein